MANCHTYRWRPLEARYSNGTGDSSSKCLVHIAVDDVDARIAAAKPGAVAGWMTPA
jgi:hypothetical protein